MVDTRAEKARTEMIIARLKVLWVIIQDTHPDNPYPKDNKLSKNIQEALRTVARKRALEEFQPLFEDLMGGERVYAVTGAPINWGD